MSGHYENLPFQRGRTYGAADNTLAVHLEGREYIHEDQNYGTGMNCKVRICRNNSGIALQPKRLAKFNLTAGKGEYDVAGYADVLAEPTAVIDDLLGPGGVPAGDLFYCVIAGPCLVLTDLAAGASNVIAVGDYLHSQTAATTGATTAGRVTEAVFTGATAVLAGQITNVLGRAMSAATTGSTNSPLLVAVGLNNF